MRRKEPPANWTDEVEIPRVSDSLSIRILEMHEVFDAAEFRKARIERADLTGAFGSDVIFREMVLEKCRFTDSDLAKSHWDDILFEEGDLSNAQMLETNWQRLRAQRCRMTGIQAGQGYFKNVLLQDCRIDLANFRYGELIQTGFVGCDMRGADFEGCTFRNVHFEKCDLKGAIFKDCKVEALDLRSSSIAEALGVVSLRGAIIDSGQAVELAPMLARAAGLLIE